MERRFLARRSEDGYVNSPAQALPGEPEAVSEDEQVTITEESHRKVKDGKIAARAGTAAEIERELEWLDARGQYLRRQLRRLGRPV